MHLATSFTLNRDERICVAAILSDVNAALEHNGLPATKLEGNLWVVPSEKGALDAVNFVVMDTSETDGYDTAYRAHLSLSAKLEQAGAERFEDLVSPYGEQ